MMEVKVHQFSLQRAGDKTGHAARRSCYAVEVYELHSCDCRERSFLITINELITIKYRYFASSRVPAIYL